MHSQINWIIDADVARSASDRSEHPTAIYCRDFLETVKEQGHVIVMSAEIQAEWYKHASVYTSTWLYQMLSKGKYKLVKIQDEEKLVSRINSSCSITEDQKKIAIKDAHLVESALKTDKHIASGDNKARRVFVIIANDDDKSLKEILWLNPQTSAPAIIAWLNSNDKPSSTWYL